MAEKQNLTAPRTPNSIMTTWHFIMKPGVPWSVKGIKSQAREVAKSGARHAGMTLGEWLNQKILEDTHTSQRNIPPRLIDEPPEGDQPRKLSPMKSQATSGVMDAIVHVRLNRIDNHLSNLQSKIERVSESVLEQAPLRHESFNAFERALNNVVDHVELIDTRNAEVLRTIQLRLTDLANRTRDDISFAEGQENRMAITELQGHLHEISKRVEVAVQSKPERYYEMFEKKLSDLAAKIDCTRKNPAIDEIEARLTQMTSKLSTTELIMTPRSEFHQMKREIGKLRNEVSQFAAPVKTSAIQTIEDRLKSLDHEVTGIRSYFAFNKTAKKLADQLNTISTRFSPSEDALYSADKIRSLEQQLNLISERLDQSANQTTPHPQIVAIADKIGEIETRINKSDGSDDVFSGISELKSQINDISSRLIKTEKRFSALESIERNLAQLCNTIDVSRPSEIDADNIEPKEEQTSSISDTIVLSDITNNEPVSIFSKTYETSRSKLSHANEDFIAAARQAAHAASQAPDGLDPSTRKDVGSKPTVGGMIGHIRSKKQSLLFISVGLIVIAFRIV